MRLALAAVVILMGTGSGWADAALPIVDIDTLCAQAFKTSPAQRDQCVSANQVAYDEMKPVWESLPEEITTSSLLETRSFQPREPWFYFLLAQIVERRLRFWQESHPGSAPHFQP